MKTALEHLRSTGIAYREMRYPRPLLTVSDVARQEFIAHEQVAKAMGITLGGRPAIVLLPGNQRLDLTALELAAGEPVRLLPADEVEATFGVVLGAMTPLLCGERDLPLIIDGRLMDQKDVSISSGDPMLGIRLDPDDLPRLSATARVVDLATRESRQDVIEPRVLKGFRDYLPAEMRPRQRMMDRIVDVFRLFGFSPLQTPAIEYADILLGKYGADAEKLLYRFRDNGGRDVCLRYDLTVPLARVAAQYPDLQKPFRRYQIAPVWRAEKPGRGRFREFFQCDADVVGSGSLLHDAECIALDHSVMTALGVERFVIRVSTRKMLGALSQAIGVHDDARLAVIFRTIDKLPSQGEARVRELLGSDAGCDASQVDRIMRFTALTGDAESMLEGAVTVLGDVAKGACDDLATVLRYARALGVPDDVVALDFSIARGLDYYTGTVYETFLSDLPGFGSVMSGGRYDALISRFLGKSMPAVGISVGIDRLFAALTELRLLDGEAADSTVAVAAFDPSCVEPGLDLVARLRSRGISSQAAFDDAEGSLSFKKQLRFAEKRGASFTLLVGPEEIVAGKVTVRNMETREQTTVGVEEAIDLIEAERNGREAREAGSWELPFSPSPRI